MQWLWPKAGSGKAVPQHASHPLQNVSAAGHQVSPAAGSNPQSSGSTSAKTRSSCGKNALACCFGTANSQFIRRTFNLGTAFLVFGIVVACLELALHHSDNNIAIDGRTIARDGNDISGQQVSGAFVADCLERQAYNLEYRLRYFTNQGQENRWPLGPDCEKYIDWLPEAPKNIEKYFHPLALSNDTTYNSTANFNIASRNQRSATSLSFPGQEEQVTVISTLGFVTKLGIILIFLVYHIVVVALLCLALWRIRKSQSLLPVITCMGLMGSLVIFLSNVSNGPASSPVTSVLWLFTIVAVVGLCATLWRLGTLRELITVLGSTHDWHHDHVSVGPVR